MARISFTFEKLFKRFSARHQNSCVYLILCFAEFRWNCIWLQNLNWPWLLEKHLFTSLLRLFGIIRRSSTCLMMTKTKEIFLCNLSLCLSLSLTKKKTTDLTIRGGVAGQPPANLFLFCRSKSTDAIDFFGSSLLERLSCDWHITSRRLHQQYRCL